MRQAHTVEQVRAAEGALMATLPEGALMQGAAAGLAHAVVDLLGGTYGRRVLLLVGPGDNGADALYAGARLATGGAAVEAVLVTDRVHEPALAALRAAGGRVVERPRSSRRPEVVLDGVLGIGGRPGLPDGVAAVLEAVAGVPVVAVDVPSGVAVDSGETPAAHVEATLTVTFGTHKVCHLVDPAARACGAVHLVDIGLELPAAPVESLQAADVAALLPRPTQEGHKYSRGVAGVRAGSKAYPGAALLCVAGAACGLAGMVRFVGDPAVDARVRAQFPEVVGAGRVQAWAVGSGGGEGTDESLEAALADDVPVVVDADALQFLGLAPVGRPVVVTPHAGELAAMLGISRDEVEQRPLVAAREAAAALQCVVLLKGRRTLVAHPDGRVRVNTTGVPWLATAGAGDVLAGLLAALLASGLPPYDAAAVGAWLHGAAATLAARGGPLVASAVAQAVPAAVREVLAASTVTDSRA